MLIIGNNIEIFSELINPQKKNYDNSVIIFKIEK